MASQLLIPDEISHLISRGALFVINHSGGKDSQAMTIKLAGIIPKNQLVIVHAHLPEVEWDGSLEHIKAYSSGIEVRQTTAVKTFFEMVEHRGMFPDEARRQCTSDLKRGPIDREIRVIAKERGSKVIVSCQGMRASESPNRSKLLPFKLNTRNSLYSYSWIKSKKTVEGRPWYDWLPIFNLSTKEVFHEIHSAGQKAFWTYYKGMTRKSCCFCIMANQNDLKIASELRPELYTRYVETERRLNFTLQKSGKFLPEIVGKQILASRKSNYVPVEQTASFTP